MRPAIVIGLGGTGAKIVDSVYGRIPKKDRDKAIFFAFDTDMGDMEELKHLDAKNDVISIGRQRTVQQIIVENKTKKFDYLSTERDIMSNNLSDGAAQVRMLSRFALENLQGDAAQKIANKINHIASNRFAGSQGANLYLVSSVAGGTGSGLLLPLAFTLKNYLSTALQKTLLVKAIVLFPDVYTLSNDVGFNPDEKRRVRANAYAFFKEWKTYNDIFRNEYKYKKNIDLMSLQLLDLGGMNALTPDRLKANSDFLDPIDIFVGIDSVGAGGGTLQYLSNYIKMTENYLFLDLASNMGSQAESRLDNALSDFVKSGGMNKMASFGSTSLVYPFDEILKFAPASLLLNSLNDRWMQIDDKFDKAYAEYLKKRETDSRAKEPVLKNFFIQTFNDYAQSGYQQNYFKRLLESLKTITKDEFGMVTGEVTYENSFFEKMNAHLTTNIKNRTFEFKGKSKKIITLENDIKELLPSINIDGDYEDAIFTAEKFKKAYLYMAENETDRIANDLLDNYLNMSDAKLADLKRERKEEFNLAHYILGENEALHPLATRYFLYKLSKRIKAEKEKLYKIEYNANGTPSYKGSIPALKNEIKELQKIDYYEWNAPDMQETIVEAIELIKNSNDGSIFKRIFQNRKSMLKKVLEEYVSNTARESELISRYYSEKVKYNIYDKLEKRVDLLIEYWENLFKILKHSITDNRSILQKTIKQYGEKLSSEPVIGMIKLFDNYELRKDFVLERLGNSKFNPDTFDYKITELFYKDALADFSYYPYEKDKEDIINKNFDEMVLNKLEEELKELKVFDINVIEAIIDEAKLKKIEKTKYLKDKLFEIKQKAGPFMNPSISNESKRSFNAWGINDESNKMLKNMYQDDAYIKLFGEENVLNQEQKFVAQEKYESHIPTPAISKYEIIRNNFDYNFSLNNLHAFSAIDGLDTTITSKNVFNSGGPIYKSYYQQKLALWDGNEVTAHLDKRWDSLFVLNDLNGGVDELFEKEVKKAFIRGLAMKWFKSIKDNETNENTWKFEYVLEDESVSMELKHINGKAAGGTFYNLYEVLLDNIGLVLKINGYSDIYGKYNKGYFDKQYEYDVEKLHYYDNWNKHKFILNIKTNIRYSLHLGTDYTIFDVFFKLHKEKNSKEVKELGKELIRLLIEELKDYQKRFGEDTYTTERVRRVVKDILRESNCAKDVDCGKNGLREIWIESIISLLGFKSRDIELKDIFKMKGNFYIADDENDNVDDENNI